MEPARIENLLREARDAFGSANAGYLGDLVERMAVALQDMDASLRGAEARWTVERSDLEARIDRMAQENARLSAEVEALKAEVSRLTSEVEVYRDREVFRGRELDFLRAKVFGSTSERSSRREDFTDASTEGDGFFDEGAETEAAETATSDDTPQLDSAAPSRDDSYDSSAASAPTHEGEATDASGRKRGNRPRAGKSSRSRARKAMRAKDPKSHKLNLGSEVERQEVDVPVPIDLDLFCPACCSKARDHGVADSAREIDLKPTQVVETTYRLHEARCLCGALRFTMPGPARGVPQTIFSPRFIAQLIADKFVSHLPGHRQSKRFGSQGITIDYRRINNLIVLSWLALKPLVDRVRELNRQELNQSVDESPIRVVIDGEKEQRWLWCLVSALAVTFVATKKRDKQTARDVVGSQLGTLTSDRLSVYRKLFEGKADSGCLAHCRRYFWYALPTAEPESLVVIEKFKELYVVEDEAKERALEAEERKALRQEKSAPLMAELKAMVEAIDCPPRSPLGRAKTYTLKHWKALTYFLEDGAVEIDNNRTESQLRDPKLGQKNYLFSQSEDGLEALAGHYTMTRTIQLYGHDPVAYLADVLGKINSGWPKGRIDELLPWNWRPPNRASDPPPPVKRAAPSDAAAVRELPRVRARVARARAEAASR